jgi:hypothetical protein
LSPEIIIIIISITYLQITFKDNPVCARCGRKTPKIYHRLCICNVRF